MTKVIEHKQNDAYRILIVEDTPKDMGTISHCIRQLEKKIEICEASSYEQAEQIFTEQSFPFDLLIIDQKLADGGPGDEGIRLVEIIKSVLKRHSETPIIIVTVLPDIDNACKAYEAGAACYLSKRKDDYLENLKQKVNDLLNQKEKTSAIRKQIEVYEQSELYFKNNQEYLVDHFAGEFLLIKEEKIIDHDKNPTKLWGILNSFPTSEQLEIAVIRVPYKKGNDNV
jgi:response regulator RpfG family c-di-GMP phosphodiesterase